MNRQARADYIRSQLASLYPQPPIPLTHHDPFTLLVAVVLSAQCTDERVNRITPALFAEAPTPEKMAALPVAHIEQIIRPCGLAPAKARGLAGLSQILVTKHGGRVPASFEALEALPGVGHKTASVVLAQAFGLPTFPVDTHIHRLACHWNLSNGSNVVRTERDLKALFPMDCWRDIHLQFIYYGREHFPARIKDPTRCAIFRHCFPGRKQPFLPRRSTSRTQ